VPLKAKDYPIPVGLRISPTQAEKLDTLSALTGLGRNSLLRLLIERVGSSTFPSIPLDTALTRRTEALEGVSDVVGVAHHGEG
jgi:hypothetical protein